MNSDVYSHFVQYYETDKMGITHHSNYIRWMEEARVHYLEKIGWSFVKFEESGLISPVVSVSGKYLSGCKFADTVLIYVNVSSVKGARFTLTYEMVREEGGEKVFEGESVHCFKNPDGIPLRLERDLPEFYAELSRQMGRGKK